MPIALADKIVALFAALSREDVEAMSPAQRERFRALCGYWAETAKPKPRHPRSGVLYDLKRGRTDE